MCAESNHEVRCAVDSAHALTADVSVAETASAAELFLADGVVLTGTATGLPADPGELRGERTHQEHAAGPESASGYTSLYVLFLKEKKKGRKMFFRCRVWLDKAKLMWLRFYVDRLFYVSNQLFDGT